MKEIFQVFSALIDERLSTKVFTTEDSVRYTFFLALLESGFCKHTDILLEMPHPSIPKAEVDLFISAGDNRPATAFEFKFDRPIPSEKNSPRTQKAGAVFKDLFRLARVPAAKASQRYFIYLAASEMADYFRNPDNRLAPIFGLPEGKTYTLPAGFVNGFADTFQRVAGEWATPCSLLSVYSQNLSHQHALRIYLVQD